MLTTSQNPSTSARGQVEGEVQAEEHQRRAQAVHNRITGFFHLPAPGLDQEVGDADQRHANDANDVRPGHA